MIKVIFLDIDGVLQPGYYQNRFKHDLEELRKELAEKYNDPEYLKINEYDLGAVYYDWHPQAVKNLKTLLKKTGAKIVISSNWKRNTSIETLKRLFKIHDLDEYIIDKTPDMSSRRGEEIKTYLAAHPEIENFIILDDEKFTGWEQFKDKFVHCSMFFEKELAQAIEILS